MKDKELNGFVLYWELIVAFYIKWKIKTCKYLAVISSTLKLARVICVADLMILTINVIVYGINGVNCLYGASDTGF